MKQLKLVHYSDAGHGWVAVKREMIDKLGLTDRISSCSFQSKSGLTVYLEEDGDASSFIQALIDSSIPYVMVSKYTDKTSPIRSYPRYKRSEVL